MTSHNVQRTFVVFFLLSSVTFSACLDSSSQEYLPPYQENYSADGGMYMPREPQTSSGYGSGASNYASGASGAASYASGANDKSHDKCNSKPSAEDDQGELTWSELESLDQGVTEDMATVVSDEPAD